MKLWLSATLTAFGLTFVVGVQAFEAGEGDASERLAQNVEPAYTPPTPAPPSSPTFELRELHFSESADSNPGDTLGGSSFGAVTRGLGSLTLQKLWKNYAVAMDYIGGVVYDSGGVGLEQLQQFDMDNRINWKRGQLAIRDSVSYLPEGTFGR